MAEVINVYGLPQDWKPPTKEQFHGNTYLEYSIPEELEEELSKMIDEKLDEFYKKCKCESCKNRKNDS